MQIKNNIHKNLQAAPALRNTLLATLALAASASWAQDAPATATATATAAAAAAAAAAASAPVRFASYLDAVERHNIGLSAQQETIRSAEAEISIAGVRPDPVLKYSRGEIETSSAVSAKPPRTHEFEVEIPIELGGKRSARACRQQQPASDRSQPAGLQAHAVPGVRRGLRRGLPQPRSPGPAGIDAGRADQCGARQ
ncbi:hypothetical protein ACU4GI_24820 [Cupriavidus basilensis]